MLTAIVLLSSCDKEARKTLTPQQVQQRIDSITAGRVYEAELRARKELEHRMKIEIKVKLDSIARARELRAQAAQPSPADTMHQP
ncbi:hypothetical protein GCM10023093_12590 [Nemorincola caseinilytica]|uniref:Uncharacterized protein n=1 Tax=Nemorincola caseinilytica TaxID=2054315 RepID=A0ABP8NDU8_9BACT